MEIRGRNCRILEVYERNGTEHQKYTSLQKFLGTQDRVENMSYK